MSSCVKLILYYSMLINSFLVPCLAKAQCIGIIFEEDFSSGIPANWSTGSPAAGQKWTWTADGTASESACFWGERESIGSSAIVYNSDAYDSDCDGENQIENEGITTPIMFLNNTEAPLFFMFRQYYRNFNSTAIVELYIDDPDGATLIDTIYDNNHINSNVETTNGEQIIIDLSKYSLNDTYFFRFVFSGSNYFWIVDDVQVVCDQNPFPTTNPPKLGDYLTEKGKMYTIDSEGSAYAEDQLVVQFEDNLPETNKMALRDTFEVDSFRVCLCNENLELWYIGGPEGGGELNEEGFQETDIIEKKKALEASSERIGTGFNYYTYSELQLIPQPVLPPIPAQPSFNSQEVRIAILDTGINPDKIDTYLSDGFSLIGDNSITSDDNGHGTAVAQVLISHLAATRCNNFKVVPVKTHDADGIGLLFDVTCGVYFGLREGARVFNISWGWYGEPTLIFRRAMETARDQNGLFILAVGNDSRDLNTQPFYPTNYPVDNKITVTALTDNEELASYANYSDKWTDVGSMVSQGLTGTSFAAPIVTAGASMVYCQGVQHYAEVKAKVLECANVNPGLMPFINGGKVVNLNIPCLEISESCEEAISLFPNPADKTITVLAKQLLGENVNIRMVNSLGQSAEKKSFDRFGENEFTLFDLQGLSGGLYYMSITRSNAPPLTCKFIKQ